MLLRIHFLTVNGVHSGNKSHPTWPHFTHVHAHTNTRTHTNIASFLNLSFYLWCWLLLLLCGCSSATESRWMRAPACFLYFYTSLSIGGAGSGWNMYYVCSEEKYKRKILNFFHTFVMRKVLVCIVSVYTYLRLIITNRAELVSLTWWIVLLLTIKQNVSLTELTQEVIQNSF